MLCAFILVDIIFPGKDLWPFTEHIDVDLNTGVLRQRYYFWVIPLKSEIIQTPFSRMASKYVDTDRPVWKEDYKGVFFLAKGGGGGKRIYFCDKIALIMEHSDTLNISPEEKKDYILKALGFLRENNIEALEDLTEELSKKTREY